MNRFCLGYRRYFYGGSFLFFNKEVNVHDLVEDPPEFVPKTGTERVIKAFSETKPGQVSKEFISLVQITSLSFIMGVSVGGFKTSRRAYGNFMIANQHTKFLTPFEARRRLHDTVFLAFFKGGATWGLKAALFTGIYCVCVIAIPAYRNKEGLVEYFVGGALAGAFSRLYLGIKATLAGGLIGGIFATSIGIITFLSSTSMSEIRDVQYEWYKWRKEAVGNLNNKLNKKRPGNEFSSVLDLRELQMRKQDTKGYSESDTVYIVIPNPDEVDSSTEPTKNATEEVEDKK